MDGVEWRRLKGNTKVVYAQQNYKGTQYLYPQALHKQLFNRRYRRSDFRIFINPFRKYYFPQDFRRNQAPKEFSSIDVLTHEMLHGLGMITAFGNHAQKEFSSRMCPVKMEGIRKVFCVSFFDKFIRDKHNRSIPGLIRKMNQQDLPTEAKDEIILSNHHRIFTTHIKTSTTESGGLYFKTKSGRHVYLKTNIIPFKAGGSISHIDLRYKDSNETLMTRAIKPGQGTNNFAADCTWKTPPLAPSPLKSLLLWAIPETQMPPSIIPSVASSSEVTHTIETLVINSLN
ncbi:hypothetical protein DSO57_1028308 [Entomophthora muscae]|uniref:Uncharacterized protein n=1 Tax=Entomophthora muscae TaxID=34485 RepID=A0ACC2T1S7_9FUNG|nr:hypothetical protein DSO57_1028308 [Entomophthora muscae]